MSVPGHGTAPKFVDGHQQQAMFRLVPGHGANSEQGLSDIPA